MAKTKPSTVKARKAASGGSAELERLRKICMAIPGAFEKLSHGEPTWFTGPKGKVFAMFDNHHHGAAHISAYFAASIEAQELLVADDPDRYWVPPYVGHKGWIAVVLDTRPDWKAVARLAQEAFASMAAAKPARAKSTARARTSGRTKTRRASA
jgi:predicted DNA-binding protein (MmcQ/YjbR family)